MSRTFVILNPWAGRGAAGRKRPELEQALHDAGIDYMLRLTHVRGGATELTCQAIAQGYTRVVAVGGDGTINEIVNGIKRAERTEKRTAALGIVPLGTGSDFARTAFGQGGKDLHAAVQRLANGRTRAIDVGHVQVAGGAGRFFLNGLGLGLDAQAAAEALKIRRLKGLAVYLVAILRAQRNYQAPTMSVRYDSAHVRRRLLFASVANGRFQASGFLLTPDAQIDDGKLDVCIVDHMGLLGIMRHLPKVVRGTHARLKEVTLAQVRAVTVDAEGPIPVATDGEVVTTDARTIHAHILPQSLELLV
ncbi:MAG TPA: diacylglycerol kinase family protein [Roseiflexaceae bacterium]|jgi:YegS/Rv2252/BmrU family lipid kinase|nr:diacylglycerol kinase family protein [Roseiflexaceae bacterium]